PGALLGCGLLRRAVLAEGVVALEQVGTEVVDVDQLAGRDVARGEADDLAVLADGVALGDLLQRDLVAEADAGGEGDVAAAYVEGLALGEVAGGDGDVVFGAEVDGGARKCGHLVGLVRGDPFTIAER